MFSYDLSTTVGQVRLRLGDNRPEDGVLPGGGNFSDEEILYLYGESSSDIWYTVYSLAIALVARWTSIPENFNADGLIVKINDAAARWRAFADRVARDQNLYAKYDLGRPLSSIGIRRVDAGDSPSSED